MYAQRFMRSTEGNRSAETETALRTGAIVLSNVARHVEGLSSRSSEGAGESVRNLQYPAAGDSALVAVGTVTLDGIGPCKGIAVTTAAQSSELSSHRRGGERDVVAGHGTS